MKNTGVVACRYLGGTATGAPAPRMERRAQQGERKGHRRGAQKEGRATKHPGTTLTTRKPNPHTLGHAGPLHHAHTMVAANIAPSQAKALLAPLSLAVHPHTAGLTHTHTRAWCRAVAGGWEGRHTLRQTPTPPKDSSPSPTATPSANPHTCLQPAIRSTHNARISTRGPPTAHNPAQTHTPAPPTITTQHQPPRSLPPTASTHQTPDSTHQTK